MCDILKVFAMAEKQNSRDELHVNRPFPSFCEPHYESEAKCKTFHMKISFVFM